MLQFCHDLEIVINWGKSDLELKQWAQSLKMLVLPGIKLAGRCFYQHHLLRVSELSL